MFLERLPSEIKDRIGAEVTDNSDKIMICSTTFPSTSNKMKNLLVNSSYHSSYTKKINDEKEEIFKIFSEYFVPQIK